MRFSWFFGYGMGLILIIDFMAQDGQIVLAPTLQVASQELVLPAIRQRVARAQSLQELRGVSLQLRAPRGELRVRQEAFLGRQPFFRRGGRQLGECGSEQVLGRRSNFFYNYCLRNQ